MFTVRERTQTDAAGEEKLAHRDCHVRPDLVLLYRKPDALTLQRIHLDSHCGLGL